MQEVCRKTNTLYNLALMFLLNTYKTIGTQALRSIFTDQTSLQTKKDASHGNSFSREMHPPGVLSAVILFQDS